MSKVVFKFNSDHYVKGHEDKKKRMLPVLKSEIVRTTEPYVPFDTGELAHSVYASINDGTDRLIYRKPYGHFLYVGLVMIGTITGRVWAKKYEIKSYTTQKLKYRKVHPKATSFWFDKSKKKNLSYWVRVAKELLK